MNDPDAPATERGEQWEVKLRGRKLATMWLVSAILGATLISLTMGIGLSSQSTGLKEADDPRFVLFRLSIPLVIMTIYAWLGYKYANNTGEFVTLRRARLGQLADSLYFLGFLWTLWALIDSFVIHQMSIAEAVFRAFGYALVTTAFGMFLRLLLLQFAYSEEDQVRLGGRTVEQEIGRFAEEVSRAVESLIAFRARTDTAVTAWIDSLNKSGGNLKTAVDEVTAQTADFKDALLKMHQASADHVDCLVEMALGQFTRKVEPSLDALNKANRSFVAEVNTSTATLAETLRSSTTRVETAVSVGVTNIEGAAHAGAMQMQSEVMLATNAIANSVVKSTQTIETATAAFATKLSAQMANLESDLASLSTQIREIRVPVDIVEKTVAQQLATLNASLLKSKQTVEEATGTFATALSGRIAGLQSDIANVSKQIQDIRVPSDVVENTIRQQLATVNAGLLKSTGMLEDASAAFATKLSGKTASLESELRKVSERIREIRVPNDIVEKTVEQQLASVKESLLNSAQIVESASHTFATTLSTQMVILESDIKNLSKRIRRISVPADTPAPKRWWKFWG